MPPSWHNLLTLLHNTAQCYMIDGSTEWQAELSFPGHQTSRAEGVAALGVFPAAGVASYVWPLVMLFRCLSSCYTGLMTSALVPAPATEALVEGLVVAVVGGSLWTQSPTSPRLMVFSDSAAAVVAAGWPGSECMATAVVPAAAQQQCASGLLSGRDAKLLLQARQSISIMGFSTKMMVAVIGYNRMSFNTWDSGGSKTALSRSHYLSWLRVDVCGRCS